MNCKVQLAPLHKLRQPNCFFHGNANSRINTGVVDVVVDVVADVVMHVSSERQVPVNSCFQSKRTQMRLKHPSS